MRRSNDIGHQAKKESMLEMLNQKSPLTLINELESMLIKSTEFDLDVELVEGYLDVLQQKTPITEEFDTEALDRDFMEKHSVFYEAVMSSPPKQKTPKISYRIAGPIAAAACLLLVLLIAPIDASGNSFINRIVHWGEEVLTIRRLPLGGNMTLPADNESEYRSLADALEKNGISSAGCPTWIPTGFALIEIETSDNGATKTFIAVFQNAEKSIQLTVKHYIGNSTATSIEKDPGGTVYISHGQKHYILTNIDVPGAVWADDNVSYQILGDISIDDLQIMLDSIYERR